MSGSPVFLTAGSPGRWRSAGRSPTRRSPVSPHESMHHLGKAGACRFNSAPPAAGRALRPARRPGPPGPPGRQLANLAAPRWRAGRCPASVVDAGFGERSMGCCGGPGRGGAGRPYGVLRDVGGERGERDVGGGRGNGRAGAESQITPAARWPRCSSTATSPWRRPHGHRPHRRPGLRLRHPFLGLGPTGVPMATADVLTVLSSQYSSFKIANIGEVVGAFEQDRQAGIAGRIGPRRRWCR